ncbi:hypothetical protein GINT2_000982 [Glugoides intestinalis]
MERSRIADKILKNLPNTNSITHDCIRKCIKQDMLIYIPAPDSRHRLIEDLVKYTENSLIITRDAEMRNKMAKMGVPTLKEIRSGRVADRILAFPEEFLASAELLKVLHKSFVTIFDEVKSIVEVTDALCSAVPSAIAIRICITDDPRVFSSCLGELGTQVSCYVNEAFIKKSFYRTMMETTQLFYFDDFQDIYENMNETEKYETDYKRMVDITTNTIGMLKGAQVAVYVEEREVEMMKRILKELDPARAPMSILLKNVAENVGEEKDKRVVKVFFNFHADSYPGLKVYILPLSFKEIIRQIVTEDMGLGETYSTYLKRGNIDGMAIRTGKCSVYKFEVLQGDVEVIKGRCKPKQFIFTVNKVNKKIYVKAICSIGKTVTCFNLFNVIKEPIVVPRSPTIKMPLFLACNGVEFCTVTSLKERANSRYQQCNGYLEFFEKKVVLYSFSAEKNMMIEFNADDIEEYIFLTMKKSHEKAKVMHTQAYSEAAVKSPEKHIYVDYMRQIEGRELPRDFLTMTFCLRNRPKIYETDSSAKISKMISGSAGIEARCIFFTSLVWRRMSMNEFKEGEERYDLRMSIPCFQDVPPSSLELFMTMIRDASVDLPFGAPVKIEQVVEGFKRSILSSILKMISNYPARIVVSDLVRMSLPISLKSILEYFYKFEFTLFYEVACLISRKGRYLVSKIRPKDLELEGWRQLGYCQSLDRMLHTRFTTIDFQSVKLLKSSSGGCLIRNVIITPLCILFEYEQLSESNRVLRNFDPDKFCRVLIREENGRDKFFHDPTRNTDGVYEHFRRIMLNGLQIGYRKYFFLVMTTSQLKVHGSWFVTPHVHESTVIGADYIKSWIGSFNKIKNIGKYAARIGLALSSTTATCNIDDFIEIEDTENGPYCFTDGIGLMSRKQACKVAGILGLSTIPSAFQIRFGGYKGVVAVHPWIDDSKQFLEWAEKSCIISGGYGKYDYKSTGLKELEAVELILRKSMKKFDSTHRGFEVISVSKSSNFYLNRQIIQVLEGLGVSPSVFIDLQDKYIRRLLLEFHNDFTFTIKNYTQVQVNASPEIPFNRHLQTQILANIIEDLNTRAKIFIPQGRGAIGVIDELGILEEDQVFFMFQKRLDENMESLKDYGSFVVPDCHCIVAKNPVMHPGDIRLIRCVDVPQLHYLRDVVVFSKKGPRPVFNQCSGSDLDGDIFLVSWCRQLIPKVTFKPYDYKDDNALTKESVLLSDIVNFYIRHMKFYQLGSIAHSYLAIADKHSLFDERALKLSEIFNKSIDYAKTGNVASIPMDLLPTEYPDFMQRSPSYPSAKTLGYLYRRTSLEINGLNFCECHSCSLNQISKLPPWWRIILLGSGITTREIKTPSPASQKLQAIYDDYVFDIRLLMNQVQEQHEAQVFCNASQLGSRNVIKHYADLLKTVEALEMASVCKCKGFDSILALCGVTHTLKGKIIYNSIKQGSSHFIFNSKIHLIPFGFAPRPCTTLVCPFSIGSFYKNCLDNDEVSVWCNLAKYEALCLEIPSERIDFFKDFFNLLLLSETYKITDIDKIISLFEEINKKMKCSSLPELLRVAIPGSNNTIFRTLLLLPLNLSIINKAHLLREKATQCPNENHKSAKICKRLCLIISGMLDENDDVEFVVEGNRVFLLLKNKGTCTVDYYKDMMCSFLVNVLYSHENQNFLKSLKGIESVNEVPMQKPKDVLIESEKSWLSDPLVYFEKMPRKSTVERQEMPKAFYEVVFTPGRFYLIKVPEEHLNDMFSVSEIERQMLSEKLKYAFDNKHVALEPERRDRFFSTIKPMDSNGQREILSFEFNNERYDIEYLNGELWRITKGRRLIGRAYIANTPRKTDLQVEVFRRTLVYTSNLNLLTKQEAFMENNLLRYENKRYSLLFDEKTLNCERIRIERSILSSNNDGFVLEKTEYFSGSDKINFTYEKKAFYASREFVIESLEQFNFDKIFGKLWKNYSTSF